MDIHTTMSVQLLDLLCPSLVCVHLRGGSREGSLGGAENPPIAPIEALRKKSTGGQTKFIYYSLSHCRIMTSENGGWVLLLTILHCHTTAISASSGLNRDICKGPRGYECNGAHLKVLGGMLNSKSIGGRTPRPPCIC